jgi:O-antigen ligase
MLNKSSQKLLAVLIIIAGPAVGLFITPSVSTDPVNQPKMLLLTMIGFAILGLVLLNDISWLRYLRNPFGLLISLFLVQLLITVIFAPAPFTQQFFGVFGRNTGFLTYACLAIISIGAYLACHQGIMEKVAYSLLLTGIISAAYSTMQTLGADPIKWQNPYNPITAFLGNPNFQSSFLGISATVAIGAALNKNKTNLVFRICAISYILFAVFLIIRTDSQQGILVFLVGLFVVSLFNFISKNKLRKKLILIPYLIVVGLVGTILIFGMLNHGPLANLLYKLSVRQRGYYWHAALEMIKSHPFFGVGLDSFGDWYFAARSANAAFHTPTTGSNSAHNVFLDLGATGGIPLLILHLGLVLYTFYVILRRMVGQHNFNWAYAALVGAWIGYESQALISINQIGLAIWGWILMGLILGFEKSQIPELQNQENRLNNLSNGSRSAQRKKNETIGKSLVITTISAVLGLMVVFPVFKADAGYRKAISSRSGEELLTAALANPTDGYRLVQSARVFANSNLIPQAQALVAKAILNNPRSYDAWELKRLISEKDSPEYAEAKKRLNELNPKVKINQ